MFEGLICITLGLVILSASLVGSTHRQIGGLHWFRFGSFRISVSRKRSALARLLDR